MASKWVQIRDWFCLTILPIAVGAIATVIKNQAATIPGLTDLIGIVQPYIQAAYDKACVEGDLKMQAILLAVLSKLFLMTLVTPGIEVLSPEDANAVLVSMAREAMGEDGDVSVFSPPDIQAGP